HRSLLYNTALRQRDRGRAVPGALGADPRTALGSRRWSKHDTAARPEQPADGGPPGWYSTARRALALRAEMGRLSLPGFPGRRQPGTALEIGAEPRPLFPGCRRRADGAVGTAVRARRRNCHPDRAAPVLRGLAITAAPGGQPG